MQTTEEQFELPTVYRIMDALQQRVDSIVFSTESPDLAAGKHESSEASLQHVFGRPILSNAAVDGVLKELHVNYMALARHLLPVDEFVDLGQ